MQMQLSMGKGAWLQLLATMRVPDVLQTEQAT